jgi:hypothetical protein
VQRRGDHPSVSGLSGLVMVDVSGNDKEFLSFTNNKKGKGSHHLVLWLLENLMVYESLGNETGYTRGRCITPQCTLLIVNYVVVCFKLCFYSLVYPRFEKSSP